MSKMSEGLNLHIQEEEEEEEERRRRRTQSIGPHFDSGPLQPPSPQFYYHVVDMDGKTVFTRRKKSDLIKTYFQYCIELKGTNRTNRIPGTCNWFKNSRM